MPVVIEATRFGRRLPQGWLRRCAGAGQPWENRSDLLRGVEWWQAHGYRVKLAGGIEGRDAYVAGDPKTRTRALEPLGVLVLYSLSLGHGKHLATLPLGVTTTLDGDARALVVDQPALR
jgi:muramoyltetrapeptide carboxypeptidase LdcA involved in peptidoglycan recycling